MVGQVDRSRVTLTETDLFTHAPARTARQMVSGNLHSCAPDATVSEVAGVMQERHCSSMVIVEGGLPCGIWTERDALAIDFADPQAFDQPISKVMTQPVKVIDGNATISEIGLRFKRERIRHLVVVDDAGKPLGMLSQTDVVLNQSAEHFLTFRDVRSAMSGLPPVLPADMSVAEAVRLIRQSAADAVVVTAPGWTEPGIVTERDIVRAVAGRHPGTIGELCSRPVVSVRPEATLLTARNLFVRHGFRHLAVREADGALVGLLTFADILETLQYEYVAQINEALARSRKDLQTARQVIEASVDAVLITDAAGRIEYVNMSFTRLTGYSADEVIGRNPRLLKSGRHSDEFYQRIWAELAEHGHWQGEIWNRRKDGEIFAMWQRINAIRAVDGSNMKYASVFSDITERKQNEELILYQANYDALTGLPNRRLFYDRLEQELKKAHRADQVLALLFIDLDRFKEVNDTLGHHVGDQLLQEATRRIGLCVRESDTVARLGGDEFVVILTGLTDGGGVGKVAEHIIHELEQPFAFGKEQVYPSASVGITLYPGDGLDADTLLANADQAMYTAKSQGRNCFSYFTGSMQALARERLDLRNDLRLALAGGQFEVHYQPIVALGDGRIVKAEALLRWRHPKRGMVGPSQFIPIAEEAGLINDIGDWIFKEAARMAKHWQAVGPNPIQISINKSPRQFLTGNTHETWVDFLREIDLPGQCLSVEITEGLLLDDRPDLTNKLNQIRAAGMEISLDDFGTGYSALSYLKKFTIDYLKIDRSFVHGIATDVHDKTIAEAIIVMAHKLGIKVVAEGIETTAQRDLLVAAGCDYGQGYLFARPLAAADFLALVEAA